MTTESSFSLLVVDDEPDLRTLYELTLLREGYELESAGTVTEALSCLQRRSYSAVITDMRLPDGTGLDLLHWIERQHRSEKTLVITAFGSAENAVEALKAGAYDYLTKPVDLRQFRLAVAAALGRQPALLPAQALRDAPRVALAEAANPALARLAGQSAAMQQMLELIEKVSRSMAPVLLQGESGTGKELVARAIHDCNLRKCHAFVAVNCGAIPEQLLEAEFFGYRKGAFTGAHEDREGFFQAADGGTLFLDEIGDLPLTMQSKLLRSIQERKVRPVGAVLETPVNVRILSATNKDLAGEVLACRFRQDLFYRLNVIQIRVPPLRERLEDVAAISASLLERIAGDAGVAPVPCLTPAALARLQRYAFPGNVRELENLLHRALALSGAEVIDADDLGLPESMLDESPTARLDCSDESVQPGPPETSAGAAANGPLGELDLPLDLAAYLDDIERNILQRTLERHRFNRTVAGARLGLSLRQIRYRMARLGIKSGEGPALDA